MVFHDLGYSNSIEEKSKTVLSGPILADRIVACFIDFLLNLPLLFLFLSPLIQIFEKWNFYGDSTLSVELFGLICFVGFHLFVLLLTLQTVFLSQTFGQKILQIRIQRLQPIHHLQKRLSFWECLQRCYGYALSVVLLGLPLFEMMIHPQRLAFYERMSGTFAVSLAKRFEYPPSLPEIFFARIMSSVLSGVLALTGFILAFQKFEKKQIASVLRQQDYGLLCEAISADVDHPLKRMELALAHYYVTQDDECLEQEEKSFFQAKVKIHEQSKLWEDLYYLSRSITQADQSINAEYQKQICRETESGNISVSEVCVLSQYFAQKDFSKTISEDVFEQLQETKQKSTLTLLILQDHFQQQKNYDLAFSYWSQINEVHHLSEATIMKQSQTLATLAYTIQGKKIVASPSVPQKKRGRNVASTESQPKILSTEEQDALKMFEQVFGVEPSAKEE